MSASLETQLKEACQLTSAAWTLLVEREGGRWFVRAAYHLPKSKQASLVKYLSEEAVDSWLAIALKGDSSRSAPLPAAVKLEASRLFAFPLADNSQTILVAADHLSAAAQRIWRMVAALLQPMQTEGAAVSFLPNLQNGLPYDMQHALDQVLANFTQVTELQGAWLAIRRGDTLDILAGWNDPKAVGISLPIETNPLLRRLNRTLTEIAAEKDHPEWEALPHLARRASTKYWTCLPLVIGHRLIGAVALWGSEKFDSDTWKRFRDLAKQVSPSVEVIVTFNELTSHLHRLAMLNDFALTVSSAQNLDQIARRVFGLVSRSFGTEWVALYLPSMDGRLMREYSNHQGKFSLQSTALAGHAAVPFLNGRILRLSDVSPDYQPLFPDARSSLLVPLKYRGQTIGLLAMESSRPDAYSQYDEHLMVVIASHLAGLVEYGRLREEAEGRARNLGLIHEMVQQVIGLSDKNEMAQITADLLAQYFAYELAVVMLVGEDIQRPVLGFGGTRAALVQRALQFESFIVNDGITGHVFQTGDSVLVNDTSQDDLYQPLRGWDAGSEMCVALKDGDRILGIIDVESGQRNAFTNNDLLAIESLAGVLATVVSSSDQYQRLQETVHQLRVTQVELRARMTAQQETESRLVQAAKLAAVGEMAAGIAHELNNPLTTVTGFSELILDETPADGPFRADMEMILREALRARGVVRRLLDFARQGERTRARADMNEIVDDVLALTRHLIHTSNVQLDVALAEDIPWVSVDSNQIKQVLLNLVHNALQAMPNGGKLMVSTGIQERNRRKWVVVTIKDTGVGIDEQHKDRIFEPFFTTKGDLGGTGLGLSVTYGIVTDHGGTIDVESKLGEGSAFMVWLPL